MKTKLSLPWVVLAIAAATVAGLAGCEDAARRPAAYHPPSPPSAAYPASRQAASNSIAVERLPLELSGKTLPALSATPPNGVERLAEQVKAVYEQGEREFQAGDLAAAQREFDLAHNLLIESGFDLRSNPSLVALDNQITEASAYPGAAPSPQDLTSTETPSPMDEIAEMAAAPEENPTAAADPNLLRSAEGELREVPHDLPLTVNDAVLSFLNFFRTPRGRAIVETGLRRAGRYRDMIEQVLRQEGLPSDLMYMAQAESAFQPQALSRAGARGLWQFMSFRGKQYGLEHSAWVDDRQDPEKATRAAARHLRDLYAMFGDWYLAMAAYDSGPGTVQKAVERTGYADFWRLYKLNVLPQETKNYVPIILALTLIAKDPARYGIEVQPEDPIQSDDVMPGHPLSLRLVAETLDVDLDALRALNPQLLHLVTPADPSFVLHLPPGAGERFFTEMAAIPTNQWLNWRRYRVEEGDTLMSVARKYRVSPAAIAEVNGIEEDRAAGGAPRVPLDVGTKLIVPVPALSELALGERLRYRTHQGDTLESVADEFDVTPADLRKWNRLRGSHLVSGMRLTIYPGGPAPTAVSERAEHAVPAREPSRQAPAASREAVRAPAPALVPAPVPAAVPVPALTAGGEKIVHRVRPGETLYSIARAYMTTVDALRAGNRFLFSRPLQAGDALTIWSQR